VNDATFKLDRGALRRSFNRASDSYDAAATLQRTVRNELLARLQFFRLQPQHILDLGAGTGESSVALRRQYPRARVTALDIAHQMLVSAGRRHWPWRRFGRVCADANALPLATGSVELIFSSLMLQWCDDPLPALAEMRRVLRPGGLLLLSSFGPLTLRELRAAWAAVDSHAHVSEFPGLPQLAGAMSHAGFSEPVLDVESLVSYYPHLHALVKELRAIGARNAAADRPRGLSTRSQLQRLNAAYDQHRTAMGLPATYEVVYAAAFAGATTGLAASAGTAGADAAGEIVVPLSSVSRRRRSP
jgi:malonyl-CoA O-methyltransferase